MNLDMLPSKTKTKMDPEVKKAWVKALRSKTYRQGQGFLHANGEYCCLGVLCQVQGLRSYPAMGVQRVSPDNVREYAGTSIDPEDDAAEYKRSRTMPPASLCYRVDLPQAAVLNLAAMNDADASFEEIANWIEQKL